MIEILPNWHPLFVHFTVALFVVSTIFYFIAYFGKQLKLSQEFLIVARWCLWVGALVTIGTVIAGFYAYYTVAHDARSHLAMTDHRNWAIVTFITMLILAFWAWLRYRTSKGTQKIFLLGLLLGVGLLMATAWRGGELAYRYGIGVLSLPKAHGVGHNHKHNSKNKEKSNAKAGVNESNDSTREHTGHDHNQAHTH